MMSFSAHARWVSLPLTNLSGYNLRMKLIQAGNTLQIDPAFPQTARETLKLIFGENYEGYRTCEMLLSNLRKAAAIAMFKYPR